MCSVFLAAYTALALSLTLLLNNDTPYEILHGKLYDMNVLCAFGCLCYSNTLTAYRKKLEARAIPDIFLDIPSNTKGYLVLNLKSYENQFPYKSTSTDLIHSNTISLPLPKPYHFNYDDIFFPPSNPSTNSPPIIDISPAPNTTMHNPSLDTTIFVPTIPNDMSCIMPK